MRVHRNGGNKNGKKLSWDGELWYRGYNVKNLIKNLGEREFGFEKIAYNRVMGIRKTQPSFF